MLNNYNEVVAGLMGTLTNRSDDEILNWDLNMKRRNPQPDVNTGISTNGITNMPEASWMVFLNSCNKNLFFIKNKKIFNFKGRVGNGIFYPVRRMADTQVGTDERRRYKDLVGNVYSTSLNVEQSARLGMVRKNFSNK